MEEIYNAHVAETIMGDGKCMYDWMYGDGLTHFGCTFKKYEE